MNFDSVLSEIDKKKNGVTLSSWVNLNLERIEKIVDFFVRKKKGELFNGFNSAYDLIAHLAAADGIVRRDGSPINASSVKKALSVARSKSVDVPVVSTPSPLSKRAELILARSSVATAPRAKPASKVSNVSVKDSLPPSPVLKEAPAPADRFNLVEYLENLRNENRSDEFVLSSADSAFIYKLLVPLYEKNSHLFYSGGFWDTYSNGSLRHPSDESFNSAIELLLKKLKRLKAISLYKI